VAAICTVRRRRHLGGLGRVDTRFAEDNYDELYILTKSDVMIRQVVGFR